MPKTASLLQRLNSEFEVAPLVEKGPNVFTTQEYMRAVNIGLSTANRRINELLRRKKVRLVKVRQAVGPRHAYEFLGDE